MIIKKVMLFVFLVVIFFITACNRNNGEEVGDVMELQDWRERGAMSDFARGFALRDDINNKGGIHGVHEDSRDNYSRIMFVLSREEREDYPEDVLVLWPSEHTHRMLDALNYGVARYEIDLRQFSLEYPITIENIVYDWERVFELWIRDEREGGIGEGRLDDIIRWGRQESQVEEAGDD
jgi:hypothetical protein